MAYPRDLREHVVNNVVLDNTVEDVTADEAELTIDGRSSALDKSPVLGFVVGRILMGVVKVCNSNCNWSACTS